MDNFLAACRKIGVREVSVISFRYQSFFTFTFLFVNALQQSCGERTCANDKYTFFCARSPNLNLQLDLLSHNFLATVQRLKLTLHARLVPLSTWKSRVLD